MTPTSAFQWIATVAGVALVLWAGWWLRSATYDAPEPKAVTDTLLVHAPPPDDAIQNPNPPTPRTIIQWKDSVVVDSTACPVPARLNQNFGITSLSPLSVSHDGVEFNWYRPTETGWEWESRIYDVPKKRWDLGLDTGLECGPLECAFDGRVVGRYKRVSAYGGYQVGQLSRGVIWGVRVRLF